MKARTILVLAAAGMLVAACATTASTSAPTDVPDASTAVSTPAPVGSTEAATMAAPTATPVPPTDGEGDEPVVGRLSQPDLVHEFTIKNVGDVTQYRGGVATFRQDMNDSRVTGLARFEASIDQWTKAGTEWGTYTVTNEGGSWTGSCTGGVWADGNGIAWGCWLEGTGAYAGYTFFQAITKDVGEEPQIHGVIYQGAPPAG